MKEYHKIQSVFKRDSKTKFKTFTNEYSIPEFELLKEIQWVCTEKIDGTNIRVMFDKYNKRIIYGGRTNQAQIPATLIKSMDELFSVELFDELFDCDACLYGEGYGAKIQKGGKNYRQDQSFVLFDVLINDVWLKREDVECISNKLNIEIVPIKMICTLAEAINYIKLQQYKSSWGDFMAEGFVMRPKIELKDRLGRRIITKVKLSDFSNCGER